MSQKVQSEYHGIDVNSENHTYSLQTNPLKSMQKVTRRSILMAIGSVSAALCTAYINTGCSNSPGITRLIHQFLDPTRVTSLAWSPDGTRLVSGSFDFPAKIWDVTIGKLLTPLPCEDVITSVAWSPDGTRIASGQWGRLKQIVRVWDSTTAKLLTTYAGPRVSNCVAWSYDSKCLAVGYAGLPNMDRMVKIWDTTTGKDVITYHNDSKNVLDIAWSPYDPHLVASGTDNNNVYIQRINKETQTSATVLTYSGHGDSVQKVVWSPETVTSGHFIASGSGNYNITADPPIKPIGDTTVHIWNSVTGKLAFRYEAHFKTITALAWSPDGKYIASGSADSTVQVWHPFSGQLVASYTGHTGDVNAVAWSPDNKYIASGGADKTIQIWQFQE